MGDPGCQAPAPIYSFVPAHGASRANTLAAQLSRTLSERLGSGGAGRSVLLANFDGHPPSFWRSIAAPSRLDGRTRGAYVLHSEGHDILGAREVDPQRIRPLFEYARRRYSVICADLSGASEAHRREVAGSSDAIFLVASTDRVELEMAREKAEWLSSLDLSERCGLLLWRTPGGATAAEAEESTGLPVCSLIYGEAQIGLLAGWLAAKHEKRKTRSAA